MSCPSSRVFLASALTCALTQARRPQIARSSSNRLFQARPPRKPRPPPLVHAVTLLLPEAFPVPGRISSPQSFQSPGPRFCWGRDPAVLRVGLLRYTGSAFKIWVGGGVETQRRFDNEMVGEKRPFLLLQHEDAHPREISLGASRPTPTEGPVGFRASPAGSGGQPPVHEIALGQHGQGCCTGGP